MKRLSFLLLVAAMAFAACTPKTGDRSQSSADDFRKMAPAPGPAPKIELGSYEQFQLDNGLKVIVVENHKLPRVSFQLFVDAPEVHEGELAGFIDMAGSMLTKGTKTRTKAQVDEAVDFMGASLNSSGSGLFGSCLTKHTDGLLDVMADVLMNPVFPTDEFEKLKKQTLSGLALSKNDPNAIAGNVESVLNFGAKHPYGNIQSEGSTEKITVDVCKAYYQTYFRPNISYLVVVGDIKLDQAKTLAQKYFGNWEMRPVQKLEYETPKRPDQARVAFVDKPGAVQSVIHVTYPIDLKPGSPDAIVASVMNTALGGYFGSRLMSNLREDKAYTYGARSNLNTDPLIGSFRAFASVRNEVTDSAMIQFLYEINRLRTDKMPEDELAMVKNYMSGGFARSLESPQTVARFALNTVRYNLPKDYYATYLEKLSAVTADDVMAAAKKFLQPDQAYLLIVGNKPAVAEKLLPFDKDQKIEYFDPFGNLLPDEGMKLPEGLTAEQVIEDYITAVGGKDAVQKVNSISTAMSADSPMGKLEITTVVQKPNKYLTTFGVNGNVMQKMVFNGENGGMEAMGQKMPMDDETKTGLREDATPFLEMYYAERGFKTVLAGIEMVEGKKAYRIDVESPSGRKKTQYFLTENSLKLREMEEQSGQGQTVTVVTDFADYKKVEGVMIPHQMTITGAMPMPLKMTVTNAEINGTIDPAAFDIQ
ncbi:MAG: pitrilysin family protein [Saprospiraceae bacterium]